jgi:ribonuclease III
MRKSGRAATEALEARLGHRFADHKLLDMALTHASAASSGRASYQRLEFLGDRVLALAVSEMLIEAFPKANEGELAQRLTALVRNESCAEVALALDVGDAIRLGAGEAQGGGRSKAAILGDVCEALIGAIHLDAGIDAARRFVRANWEARMNAWHGTMRDAKTTLQEWAQGKGIGTPVYTIVGREGPDHAPRFDVEVTIGSLAPQRGEGRTKRDAEQLAAAAVLVREGVWKAVANGG